MITYALVKVLFILINGVFGFLPIVSLSSLPVVGSSVYTTLTTMVGVWNAFMVTVPYVALPWHIFLYVVLPFEFLLLIAKLFLGSRVPTHNQH